MDQEVATATRGRVQLVSYKLSELEFSTSIIKLISSLLTDKKFEVLIEREFSVLREIAAGCLKFPSLPQY
jgi:hypothetical protein